MKKESLLGAAILALACGPVLADEGTVYSQMSPRPAAAPATGMPANAPMPPYTFEPGPRQGDWEATLSGAGTSADKFDSNRIGLSGAVGYYALKWLPISLRQDLAFAFGDKQRNGWSGTTALFVDAQWNDGNWFQPFIGIGFGGTYGVRTNQGLSIVPEAGAKMYVNESTFVLLRTGWNWRVTGDNTGFDDGDLVYSLGVGWNF